MPSSPTKRRRRSRDLKPEAPAQVEPTTDEPAVEEETAANSDRERADVIDAP